MGDARQDDEASQAVTSDGSPRKPLALLLEVQEHDLAIDQLTYRRRELDERKTLAELDGRVGMLRERQSGVRARFESLSARQAEIEAQVEALTERIGVIEGRLRESGDYRGIQAMSAETESLARHRRQLEDGELEVMEELEPVEQERAALEGELEALATEHERVAAALAEAETLVDAELATVRNERATLAAGLPADLAATYERLRSRLGGIGAARLVDGTCGGCHLKLPSSERERVLHQRDGEISYCDQCGRILVA